MTALPPTTGHLNLVQFANNLADNGVVVVLSTQPHEPMIQERVKAFREAITNRGLKNIKIENYNKTIPQDPKTPGFWQMWLDILNSYGITKDDYIVASEKYGQKLAEITGTKFFPYDIYRDINKTKATKIRNDPIANFSNILDEFKPYLRTTITIFGAESTGKTTLSKQLADELNASWIFEYARPYLENTINEITIRSMTSIWKGQAALQKQIQKISMEPYIIQDTDLFSTVGYWKFPHWQKTIGSCPEELIKEAIKLQSDLYIFTKSNIPFEKDPLRYGGDRREGSDDYWLNICKQYNLPHIVLDSANQTKRLRIAKNAIIELGKKKTAKIYFDRKGF